MQLYITATLAHPHIEWLMGFIIVIMRLYLDRHLCIESASRSKYLVAHLATTVGTSCRTNTGQPSRFCLKLTFLHL